MSLVKSIYASCSVMAIAWAIASSAQAQAQDQTQAKTQAQDQASPSGGATGQSGEVSSVVVTGHFVATGAFSATKQATSTLDTPFSVSAYTGAFMKAIQTTQVADLYRYMTGLQKAGATGYDLTLRGFSTTDSDRNTILVDGLPGLSVRFGSPPTIGTDHVEIVKGAASLLYGAVQPGGFVNMISKKPEATPSTVLSVRGTGGGSDRDPRVRGGDISVDSTGPIMGNPSLLYRIVGQVSTDNTFRDYSFERGTYLSPSVTWLATSKTSVTAQLEYRSVASNYASLFLVAPRLPQGATVANLAPITTNYMAPGNYLHEQGLIESVFVNHAFDNGIRWTFNFRNVAHMDSAHAWDVTRYDKKDPTFNTLDLRARGQHNRRFYTFGDTYLTIPFDTGEVKHRLIAGGSLGKETDDFLRLQFCAINSPDAPNADPTCNPTSAIYTVSQFNPNFSALPSLLSFGPGAIGPNTRSRNYVTGVGSGVYASDLMSLGEHWKLLAGVRWAHEDQMNFADKLEIGPVVGDAHLVSSAVLPQAGLIYEPTRHLSFYASYSTSFSPVPPGTQDVNGGYNFQPTRGQGYEVGAKGNLMDGGLTVTAALFRIDQTNIIVPSASSSCSTGSCSEQVGAARSEGLELEASARPTPNWTLVAGYAHTNARVTSNPTAAVSGPLAGGELPNSPLDAAHLWSRYDFHGSGLDGLGVGIGYSYVSDRVAYTPTAALPRAFVVPAYSVVDLGAYYTIRNIDFTLKVNNLLDANYYFSGTVTQGKVNVQPGTPRTVMLTAAYKF